MSDYEDMVVAEIRKSTGKYVIVVLDEEVLQIPKSEWPAFLAVHPQFQEQSQDAEGPEESEQPEEPETDKPVSEEPDSSEPEPEEQEDNGDNGGNGGNERYEGDEGNGGNVSQKHRHDDGKRRRIVDVRGSDNGKFSIA